MHIEIKSITSDFDKLINDKELIKLNDIILEQANNLLNKKTAEPPIEQLKFIRQLARKNDHISEMENLLVLYKENSQMDAMEISIDKIIDTHSQLFPTLEYGLRQGPVQIQYSGQGIDSNFIDAIQVCDSIKELVSITNLKNSENSIISSAFFHGQFLLIHPFCDGNGRLARYLEHCLLPKKIRNFLMPEIIVYTYYDAYLKSFINSKEQGSLYPFCYNHLRSRHLFMIMLQNNYLN
jgi:Fic family protein